MNKYTFKPYSLLFPSLFAKEKERIKANFSFPLSIEHVGSTAVPWLGSKGIVDIAIAVDKVCMEDAKNILKECSYEFFPSFSTPDRFYFITYLSDIKEQKIWRNMPMLKSKQQKWQMRMEIYIAK